MKSDNFDFSAKWSSTDYKELNKLTPKNLAHVGSGNRLLNMEFQKNELLLFFTFFTLL